MKSKAAFSALALVLAVASTFAETPSTVIHDFVSTKSRAEVQSELFAYKKAGVNPWSMTYNPLRYFKSSVTRESVVAEFLASRSEVSAFNGEDSGSVYLAKANAPVRSNRAIAGIQPNVN